MAPGETSLRGATEVLRHEQRINTAMAMIDMRHTLAQRTLPSE
jgi:hypothetical protein